MKKLISLMFLFCAAFFTIAQTNPNHVFVNGYYRSNGTYVAPHFRTAPNNTVTDNFSYPGNYNPYTSNPPAVYKDNYERFINPPVPELTLPVRSFPKPDNTDELMQKIRNQANFPRNYQATPEPHFTNTSDELFSNPKAGIKKDADYIFRVNQNQTSKKGGKYFKVENGKKNYTVQII